MWLKDKSFGSEKKQQAADLEGVSPGACVVVDGVDARGIKRMLNEFKED